MIHMRGHEADVMCVVLFCSVFSCIVMFLFLLYGVNWTLSNVTTNKQTLLGDFMLVFILGGRGTIFATVIKQHELET